MRSIHPPGRVLKGVLAEAPSGLSVSVEAIVQCFEADAQYVGGFALVAAMQLQGRHDEAPLDLGDRGPDLEGEAAQAPRVPPELPRQGARADLLLGYDEGPV